jgi:CheY-like chemotaxis protein
VIQKILSESGYQVLLARDGRDALRCWEEQAGHVDLLLTDVVLPDQLTGRDLARKLLTRQPSLKVVLTSGYGEDSFDDGILDQHGVGFMQKPYKAQDLLRVIRQVLDA